MSDPFLEKILQAAEDLRPLDTADAHRILEDESVELLPLLNAAFQIRHKYFGREVAIHIINNAQNGFCPEDCHYCAQAKSSKAGIEEYPIKPDEEILAEAESAWRRGAFRYCMVFAGRGPSARRTEKLAQLVREIKSRYPIEVCVSAGLIDDDKARTLKDAGLDRLNHNLNTSSAHYPNICSTHTFADRVATLKAAGRAGLEVCSGVIVGMGEGAADIVEVAQTLKDYNARSIPVNFYMPVPGNALVPAEGLTPEYCLRVLCLFRFLNPDAEIRAAAGRELHLRSLQPLALYPANSIFLEGYLNTKGSGARRTLEMIRDAGFTIRSDHDLNELLAATLETPSTGSCRDAAERDPAGLQLKAWEELRPAAGPRAQETKIPDGEMR